MDDYERAATRRELLRLGVAAGVAAVWAPRCAVGMVAGAAPEYHADDAGNRFSDHQTNGSRQRSHAAHRMYTVK